MTDSKFNNNVTQRADFFNIIPSEEERLKIAEIATSYNEQLEEYATDVEKANFTLMIMAMTSFDEGYRKGLEENNRGSLFPVEIKNRVFNEFYYIEQSDLDLVYQITEERVNSKRMRNRILKEHPQKNNEDFLLAMIVNTAFESGYLKSQDIRDVIKQQSGGDQDKEEFMTELFTEVFSEVTND